MKLPLSPCLAAIVALVFLLGSPDLLRAQQRPSGAGDEAEAPKWQEFDSSRITGMELDCDQGVLFISFDGVPYVYRPGYKPDQPRVTTPMRPSPDSRHQRVMECATLLELMRSVRTIRVLTEPAGEGGQPVRITELKLVMNV